MEKILFKIIQILAIADLAESIYGVIDAINSFGISMMSSIFSAGLLYIIVFSLVAIFSHYRRLINILATLIIGVIYSYITNPLGWFGKWIIIAVPAQIIKPDSFSSFLSGVAALCFLIILLLTTILLGLRIRQYYQDYNRRKQFCKKFIR